MTKAQQQLFLTAAHPEAPSSYVLFFVLAGTGMRLSEGLALQSEDLNLASLSIRIAKAGTPLDPANVRRAMLRVLKAAQLPLHFTPHSLRHTYASILLSEGVSPAYVQEQLGHATIELTVSTYGRWLKKRAPGALDRMDVSAEAQSGSSRIFKHLEWTRRLESNQRPAVYEFQIALTSDNLSPQETTIQGTAQVGQMGLICPGSSVVAEHNAAQSS